MKNPIFTGPLRAARQGEKVYSLTNEDIEAILKIRKFRTELDPGMGGVSPRDLEDMLKRDSELVSIDLALTAACNFKCVHCYRPDEEWGKQLLEYDILCKTIDDALELGVRFFILTGGEPMMYINKVKSGRKYTYFDIVDRIRDVYSKARKPVSILTFDDVALIDQRKAEMLAERGVALCLKRDTLDHAIQNKILGVVRGSEQIEEGYKHLFNAGYGRKPELVASVNQVLRSGKLDTLKGGIDLHRWIKSNGMEHSIVPIHYCGEAKDDLQEDGIHPLEVKALYDIIAAIDGFEFNDPWKVYSAFPKNKTCNRPGRGVHVRATGNVTSCSESPLEPAYVFGNIKRGRLTDMIRCDKFKGFKEEFSHREGTFICNPEVCDLNKNFLCRGGCAARSAYSRIDVNTGLIYQNTDMSAYSKGREDPLCPGWVVLAQKQGVLKDGVYEQVVDDLLESSSLPRDYKEKIKEKVISDLYLLKFNGVHN